MSRGTILGYEVAPREQQRKIALVLLALPIMILGGAYGAFVGPTVYKTWTYQKIVGKVTAIEDKCHYSVARISRRGGRSYLTDLVDCDVARAKAAEVDHAAGEVREITIVHVAYAAADGTPMTSWFDIPAEAARDLRIGQGLALMHHPSYPHRVERVPTNAFATTHQARYANSGGASLVEVPPAATPTTNPRASTPASAPLTVAPASAPIRKKFALAKPGEEPSTIEKVSRVIAWIIIFGIPLAALWLIWSLVRRVRRSLSRGESAVPERRLTKATQARNPIPRNRQAMIRAARR